MPRASALFASALLTFAIVMLTIAALLAVWEVVALTAMLAVFSGYEIVKAVRPDTGFVRGRAAGAIRVLFTGSVLIFWLFAVVWGDWRTGLGSTAIALLAMAVFDLVLWARRRRTNA